MSAPRTAEDRASALMLMPAGVLVVLMLGAIAFDLSLLFLRQREAASLANDVANDLVTLAIDADAFRRDGTYEIDRGVASEMARALVASSGLAPNVVDLDVDVLDDETVSIAVTIHVDYVFARSIPGADDGTIVTGRATAVAEPG